MGKVLGINVDVILLNFPPDCGINVGIVWAWVFKCVSARADRHPESGSTRYKIELSKEMDPSAHQC